MSISTSELFFFSAELQKLAGVQAPQGASKQEPPKKDNAITRNIGLGTLALGGLSAAAALRNPAAAKKYLGYVKDTVIRPDKALIRGLRSGATGVTKGPGASEAASKRTSLYKDVFQSAMGGELKSVKALEDVAAGKKTLRTRGLGSVGTKSSEGTLNLSPDLQRRISGVQADLDAGKIVDENVLRGLYSDIQRQGASQGLTTSKGLGYYAPGEALVSQGIFGAVPGALVGVMDTEDAEGRKRGIAERIARGAVGAGVGAASVPLFVGRGAGLARQNVFTGRTYTPGQLREGFQIPFMGSPKTLLTQKTLLPAAASSVMMAGGAVATDVAGGGGALVDRAFGQGKEQ